MKSPGSAPSWDGGKQGMLFAPYEFLGWDSHHQHKWESKQHSWQMQDFITMGSSNRKRPKTHLSQHSYREWGKRIRKAIYLAGAQ